jgi:hypothetical protein
VPRCRDSAVVPIPVSSSLAMARLLLDSLSKSMISTIRVQQPSLLLKFRHYNSPSVVSVFDPNKKYDGMFSLFLTSIRIDFLILVKTRLLTLLTELRDDDIPKLNSRITSILSVTQQSVQTNKFNTSVKHLQIMLPNDMTKLRSDLSEVIISLQSVPAQNFESNKIHVFLLMNEKLHQYSIDETNMENVFLNLADIIDDLWIKKHTKLKLRKILADLQVLLHIYKKKLLI